MQFTQTKLDSINGATSKIIQDENILTAGKLPQVKKRDLKTKQSKGKTDYNGAMRRIARKRKKRKQGKFSREIAGTLSIQCVSSI